MFFFPFDIIFNLKRAIEAEWPFMFYLEARLRMEVGARGEGFGSSARLKRTLFRGGGCFQVHPPRTENCFYVAFSLRTE